MKTAILSDVHSNLPALEAVLEDIEEQGVKRILCLGDTVGYNAEPGACLARVREVCEFVVQGNHDMACAGELGADWFNGVARAGIEYSRSHLSEEERRYLRDLPLVRSEDGCSYVHASLDEPAEFRYILSGASAMSHFRRQTAEVAFAGHTHKPLIWLLDEKGRLGLCQTEKKVSVASPGRFLVNVGSVGQNREGRPEACYVVFDPEKREVEFRRISYDVKNAQKKILAAGLPEVLALRLQKGC
jgi:predicted phosphodiesterase